MAYVGSNDDVIDDVTWPWKVKVVIPLSLRPVFRKRIEIQTSLQRGTYIGNGTRGRAVSNGHVIDDVTW